VTHAHCSQGGGIVADEEPSRLRAVEKIRPWAVEVVVTAQVTGPLRPSKPQDPEAVVGDEPVMAVEVAEIIVHAVMSRGASGRPVTRSA